MKTYVGFWRRAGAFALDYLLILLYLVVMTLVFFLANSFFGLSQWLFTDRLRAQLTGFILITLPITLYFAFGESSGQQATWGKKRMGIKVTDYNREPISFWRALLRTILKFIPWELSHTLIWTIYFSPQTESAWISYGFVLVYLLIGLNLLSLGITKTHQTLYDFIIHTYVVRAH